jgi:ABC-2 type transport system ATP-binding protein
MGFIGPNGAGKTTTIKCMLNMVRADKGSIQMFGQEFFSNETAIKEKIGVVLDYPFYVDEWTLQDVERALAPFYENWDSKKYASCLQGFQLDVKKRVRDLSRGMKVKLMVSVALSHDAKLLILDEPTSGLDPVARDELMDILQDFVSDESRGVLFSTHITSDLEKIADYITFINQGAIAFTGEKDELMERYALVKGGNEELTPGLRSKLVSYRQHGAGFEGMIQSNDIGLLPPGIAIDPISLDEIIIYMNREGQQHE